MSAISPTAPQGFRLPVRPASPRLRLTSRGRAVFGVLLAIPLLVGALVFGWGGLGAQAGSDVSTASYTTVTVHPGDSLWSIAQRIAPDADPSEVVAQLTHLNNLGGVVLQPGDRLAVPPQYAD